jgi:hypothetical protein
VSQQPGERPSPRQQAERELTSTMRNLRAAHHASTANATDLYTSPCASSLQTPPSSDGRRSVKSELEVHLLSALGTAEGLEQERDELLDRLRHAEARSPALEQEVDRLRGENLELTAALREEAEARARLSQTEQAAQSLAAELDAERRAAEALKATLDERTEALEQLRTQSESMLRCRGGGGSRSHAQQDEPAAAGAGAGAVDTASALPGEARCADAHVDEPDEEDSLGLDDFVEEGDDDDDDESPGDDGEEEIPDAHAMGGGGEEVICDDFFDDVGAAEGEAVDKEAALLSLADEALEQERSDDEPSAAPVPAPASEPTAPPREETQLGRNMWEGFRTAAEEEVVPRDRFRTKFPPMAATLDNEGSMLLLAGGGGGSKAGIPNAMAFYKVSEGGEASQLSLHGTGIQAVMSAAYSARTKALACVQGDGVQMYSLGMVKGDEKATSTASDASGETVPKLTAAQRLDIDPPGLSASVRANTSAAELPPELRAYSVCLSASGRRLAVGMEDGALLLFDRVSSGGAGAAEWELARRARVHEKEIKSMCFAPTDDALCTAAPDSRCLWWQLVGGAAEAPAPKEIARPAFRLFNMMGGGGSKGRRKNAGPQWRCVAMPMGASQQSGRGAPPHPLFAVLNHAGGPGWVCRCDTLKGCVSKYVKAGSSMLTALAVPDGGAIAVVGSSEGELLVFDGTSLTKLLRLTPHDLFITGLMLRVPPPVAGSKRSQSSIVAITCAGDNTVRLTPLPAALLQKSNGLVSTLAWLSVFVLLVAIAAQQLGMSEQLLTALREMVAVAARLAKMAVQRALGASEGAGSTAAGEARSPAPAIGGVASAE